MRKDIFTSADGNFGFNLNDVITFQITVADQQQNITVYFTGDLKASFGGSDVDAFKAAWRQYQGASNA